MITDVVILAGGFGERLWPASSPENPKQFMRLSLGRSFLQESLFRALSLDVSGKILVVTRKDLANACVNQCEEMLSSVSEKMRAKILSDVCVLSEPSARQTAAAVMSASLFLEKLGGNESHSVLVLTSDHVIEPVKNFISDCQKAASFSEKGNLVCFAIPPTEPSTGYGYIKSGEKLGDGVFKIAQFKEKPDAKTAAEYVSSGLYSWNSGMFAFSTRFFLSEMQKCSKDVSEAFEVVKNGELPEDKKMGEIHVIENWRELESAYSVAPKVAIDTALAEKTANAIAVSATFSWTDVGSWDVFSSLGHSLCPHTAEVEAKGNFVYSDIPVALCGVDDLIVVIKNGSALVMKKGSSFLSRNVSEKMKG